MQRDLLLAFEIFMRPQHPCSLAPVVGGLSATQQLPLVQLLELLLRQGTPEQQRQQAQQGQPVEEGTVGTLSFCSSAASALASRCLAEGRKEHSRISQGALLKAAQQRLDEAAAALALRLHDPAGPQIVGPETLLLRSSLQLAAELLADEAELLRGLVCSPAGASDAEQRRAQSGAVIVQAVADALPHLRTMLTVTAGTFFDAWAAAEQAREQWRRSTIWF